MALVESNMMELGTSAPKFKLLNTVSGKQVCLSELKSEVAMVVFFICNHCPYVHHINSTLVLMANKYQKKGVQFIAISSNDVDKYPADSPDKMREVAIQEKYPFPYLYDETQEVAKAYQAECTPDFFVFDKEMLCVYRGRMDDSNPKKGVATGKDITNALDCIIENRTISFEQLPSMGCSIKWK